MPSPATIREIGARPWVAGWLWLVAVMVLATILVGGATRLTDSGLSITEWMPLVGAIPPLSEAAWRDAFLKYQAIPEYQLVNKGISLAQFKIIYWWEWAHRFLARSVGAAFLVPFLAFWLSGRLPRALIPALAGVFVLGTLQGVLGWYMVKSGLTNAVDVSQYRLAAHLALASILFALVVWMVLGLAWPMRRMRSGEAGRALLLAVLVLAQIVIGGFMAGIDAGLVTASWPDMDGQLVPDGLLVMTPWWRNLFENPVTLQFLHRLVAYCIAGLAVFHLSLAYRRGRQGVMRSGWALLIVIALQISLGIATLVTAVPFGLALLHQAGALLLLAAAVFHLHAASLADARDRAGAGESRPSANASHFG